MRFTKFGCMIICVDAEHCINLVFTYSSYIPAQKLVDLTCPRRHNWRRHEKPPERD